MSNRTDVTLPMEPGPTESHSSPSDQQRELIAYLEYYIRFGKPLEREHWGEYLAVSAAGETLLGTDPLDLLQRARPAFGPGNTVFKIGEIAVGSAPRRRSLSPRRVSL